MARQYGETHHNAKLTGEAVLRIRQMRREIGSSYEALAQTFGVGKSTVKDVLTYRTWIQRQYMPRR